MINTGTVAITSPAPINPQFVEYSPTSSIMPTVIVFARSPLMNVTAREPLIKSALPYLGYRGSLTFFGKSAEKQRNNGYFSLKLP